MTPKTSTSRLPIGYSILFLLLPFLTIAQESFQDNTDDVAPAAPIDDFVPLILLVGIYFAYRFFKTQYAIKTNN